MTAAHAKFGFDTQFEDGAAAPVAPRAKRFYLPEEVEAIRQAAFAEGEARAMTGLAQAQAAALARIGKTCAQALPTLAEVAHAHRVGSATLALACGRAIAQAALAQFPEAPVRAAIEALAREIEAAPRLIVTANPELIEHLQPLLDDTARGIGFQGAIVVRPDPELGDHAFILDFGDGRAAFDPTQAAARVTQALEAALAAEGLHAEPLIPGSES
jgi:flagellar assembly protein FliH